MKKFFLLTTMSKCIHQFLYAINSLKKSSSIMFFFILIILTTIFSCTNKDEVPSTERLNETLSQGMLKITTGIGNWDMAIMFGPDSYLLYQSPKDDDMFAYMSLLSNDYDVNCGIFTDAATSMPEIIKFDNETFYFDNTGDSLLTVLKAGDKELEPITELPISISDSRSNAKVIITIPNDEDAAKRAARILSQIIEAGGNYTSANIKALKKCLDKINIMNYYEDVESILNELEECDTLYDANQETDSLIYCFAQYADRAKIIYHDPVKYPLSLSTGSSYNITGTAATISGRIWCCSSQINQVGKYGIAYSTSPEDINLNNENGVAYASSNHNGNFSIRISGLKPNTTYYYKAFYIFNGRNHGDIKFSYGDPDAQSYMTSSYKSFTTKEESPVTFTSVQTVSNDNCVCIKLPNQDAFLNFSTIINAKLNSQKNVSNWGFYYKNEKDEIKKVRRVVGTTTTTYSFVWNLYPDQITVYKPSEYYAYHELILTPYIQYDDGTEMTFSPEVYRIEYNARPSLEITSVESQGNVTENSFGYDYCSLFIIKGTASGIYFIEAQSSEWSGNGCINSEDYNVLAFHEKNWHTSSPSGEWALNLYFGFYNQEADSELGTGDVYYQLKIHLKSDEIIYSDILHFYNNGTYLSYLGSSRSLPETVSVKTITINNE